MRSHEPRLASSPWSCRPYRGAPSRSGERLGQGVQLSRAPGEALSVGCPTEAEVRLKAASEVVPVRPANRLADLTHRFIAVQKHLGRGLDSALGEVRHRRQTRRGFEDPQQVAGGYVEISRQLLERPWMLKPGLQRLDGLTDDWMGRTVGLREPLSMGRHSSSDLTEDQGQASDHV